MGAKKILVAPLNWGLGHATRCIPIIDELIDLGHTIYLASDGLAGILLQQEYPDATYLELPSYNITYPERNFYWHWLKKAPLVSKIIAEEHQVLAHLVSEYSFDLIISDNRYGLYHRGVHSVIITHQLNLSLPAMIAPFPNALIHRLINRFDECWIPDIAPPHNISGSLSEANLSVPIRHLGLLSRMQKRAMNTKYKIAIILSGPEPLRTRLEKQLVGKLASLQKFEIVMVLGTPDASQTTKIPGIKVFTHLTTNDLNHLLNQSEIIISRAGYSSLMDYFALNKKAILIPTPHQPEQAYLADRHSSRPEFYLPKPDLSDLANAIDELSKIQPDLPTFPPFTSLLVY